MLKYIEKYGDLEADAKKFFFDYRNIGCDICNTVCTWEDVYVNVNGLYFCEDCACEEVDD